MKQKIEGGKTTANFVQVGGRCCKKCEKIITATTTNSEDNKKTEIKFPQCSNIVCECHTVKATTKPQKIEGGKNK